MGAFSAWHWLIVIAAVVLLFGSAKLPQIARSVGQSARVLKAEARGLKEDEAAAERDAKRDES
ncbi:Sec-independent protein translocase subunit TatA [Saccharopolyspora griseoalba]|uniref:Sec-independent protein translocase protein TatA n=1 Tax=Saccharopolyspora griseoalba TaxID=1431848 RepID=A0ABW2LSW3_9PSEU